jgi:hypothetical protein
MIAKPQGRSAAKSDISLLCDAACLLAVALCLQNVTLASRNYSMVLLPALGLTAIADICLLRVVRRSYSWPRMAAILLMLPTIFIVADFICRARGTFFP